MHINVPDEFKDSLVSGFLRNLFDFVDEPSVIIDFKALNYVMPYGTLLAAMGIREFVRRRNVKGLKTSVSGTGKNKAAISYLKHFSFFKFVGVEEGNPVNKGQGNNRYIPITVLYRNELNSQNEVFQDKIENKSDQLSRIIFSKDSDVMKAEMLSYCAREVIRNVFEHSGSDSCVIMAQKWADGYAEVAIADEGVGVYETLAPVYKIEGAEDAIKMAIKPGISKETAPENDDKWQNSGFGLYVISELGRTLGDFAISSDCCLMHWKQGKEVFECIPLKGTLVKLKIKTQDADYFPNILQNIVNEGERLAESIPGARKSSSKKSKLK